MYYERLRNGEAPGGQWSGVFNFAGNDNTTHRAWNTGTPMRMLWLVISEIIASRRPGPLLSGTHKVQWYAQDQWKFNRD